MKQNAFEILLGKTITSWVGCELALMPGGEGKPSIWHSEVMPFRQFFEVEIICSDGSRFNIESNNDEDGNVELALKPERKDLELYAPKENDFVRVLKLDALPKGEVNSLDIVLDEYKKVVTLNLMVGETAIALESGFISHENDGLVVQRPESFVIINFTHPA